MTMLKMTRRKRYVLIGLAVFVLIGIVATLVTARILVGRLDPYLRQQAIQYLQKRFDADVEMAALRVQMPTVSVFQLIRTRGLGVMVHVDGEALALRLKDRPDLPPLFKMKNFGFDVDLGKLRANPKTVRHVTLDGMEITIPPRDNRSKVERAADHASHESEKTGVIIEEVIVRDATLKILPKESEKEPLQFDIHQVRLESAGKDVAMKYDASLTNAKPPGEILSRGTFGPWIENEPGDTALNGKYNFDKADLGVFDGIAGVLNSNGEFAGTLSMINVRGEAFVPDFRLKISGNRVPLKTKFEVLVDGTNGNTVLKPVVARLGTTDFTTSGGVIKHEGEERRTISLDVSMPNGNIQDVLRLAMKGSPFMAGRVAVQTKIDIPPLSGKVREKLQLDGRFEVKEGRFLQSNIQNQIDGLSRRGQGQPNNEAIEDVATAMKGKFELKDEAITFRSLQFAVPGAAVDLTGGYRFQGPVDFHGTLKLQAKVSQTMTGWKRWVLKPIDPFFSKEGAGTFLHIKVEGTAEAPKFGLDRGKKKDKG